jgi:formate/nitrite transporter FocA (FNT family)
MPTQNPVKLREEAEQRSAPPASVVYEAIYLEGKDELERGTGALFFSALAAGLSMGFSLVTEALLRAGLPDAPWRNLICKAGYSVGFLVVVLGRQQLFTENTLTVMLPLLHWKNRFVLAKVGRLWSIVLAGNLLGALAIAWVLGHTQVFDEATKTVMIEVSRHGTGDPFGTVLLRGIFAGWLIALMVWLMPAAQSARVAVIVIVTYLVALAGLAHVIAGSVDKLLLVTTGHLSWGGFVTGFLLPALFGNIIGGVSLVAALNHGAAGREPVHS